MFPLDVTRQLLLWIFLAHAAVSYKEDRRQFRRNDGTSATKCNFVANERVFRMSWILSPLLWSRLGFLLIICPFTVQWIEQINKMTTCHVTWIKPLRAIIIGPLSAVSENKYRHLSMIYFEWFILNVLNSGNESPFLAISNIFRMNDVRFGEEISGDKCFLRMHPNAVSADDFPAD